MIAGNTTASKVRWLALPVHHDYTIRNSRMWGPIDSFLRAETQFNDIALGIILDNLLRWFNDSESFVEETMSVFSALLESNNSDMNTDLEIYSFQKKLEFIYSDTFRLFLNLFYESHREEWSPHLQGVRITDFEAQRTRNDCFFVKILDYYTV